MRGTIPPILFWTSVLFAACAVVIAGGMMLGTLAHSPSRDVNAMWATAARRYKPWMMAMTALLAALICLMIFGEWLRRHP